MNRKLLLILLTIIAIIGTGCGALGGGGDTAQPVEDGDTPDVEQVDNNQDDEADNDEEEPRTITEIPQIPVVIAVQNIPRGTVIDRDRVDVILFPASSAPDGAFADVNDVIGKIAATDIFVEELILARKLVEDLNSLGSVGSDASAILDPSRVAIAVPIDRITSVAYALQPGDRVDIIVSMLFVDIDQDFQTLLPNQMTIGRFFTGLESDEEGGTVLVREFDIPPFNGNTESYTFLADEVDSRSVGVGDGISVSGDFSFNANVRDDVIMPVVIQPQEQQRPRLVTQRTVTDAQVVWVGEFPRDGRIFAPAPTPTQVVTPEPVEDDAAAQLDGEGEDEPAATPIPDRPTIVTLAVRPQDAVVLTYMAEAGIPLTFALRSARTQGLPDTSPVTLNYILETYNISVPESRNFGIEPAIRSIRGITLEDISAAGTETTSGEGTEGEGENEGG